MLSRIFFICSGMIVISALFGCAIQANRTNSRYIPIPVDMDALDIVEDRIKTLLHEIILLEQARHGVSMYYEKVDGTSEWDEVLSEVPYYKETEAFRFDEYMNDREQLIEQLNRHITLLRIQLEYLRYTLQ